MAHYLVRARARDALMAELRRRLDSGEILEMQPFGESLHESLTSARLQADGSAVGEELDYCQPPLAMEREAVLDRYFEAIEVEKVSQGRGWAATLKLPSIWRSRGPR
jgi:hypothetical protein